MRLLKTALTTSFLTLAAHCAAQTCAYVVQSDPNFGVTHLTATTSVDVMALHDPDGAGPQGERLYVAGSFDTAGSTPVSSLAWYDLGTGQWHSMGGNMPAGGYVNAITVRPTGEVVIGGGFFDFNGAQVNCVAKWNGFTWSAMGSGMSSSGNLRVYALVTMPNGDVIAGGQFNTAGGVPASNIARWNGTAWSPLGGGTNATVTKLALGPDGTLYAAGDFTAAGGTAANRIASWNGTSWSAVGTVDVSSNIYAITVTSNGDVIASGVSSAAAGITEQSVARWNGSTWSAVGFPNVNLPTVFGSLPGGDLLACLSFPSFYRHNQSSWTSFVGVLPNQGIKQIVTLASGDVIACGSFSTFGGPASRLARLNRPRNCSYLSADFETTTGPNAGWTTTWTGGSSATEIANGRLASAAGLIAINANNQVYYTSPPSWTGDHHGLMGGHIRVEVQSMISCTGLAGDTFGNFMLEGAGMTLVAQSDTAPNLRAQNVNTIAFLPEKWRVGSITGPIATAAEMYAVLSNVTAFKFTQNVRHNGTCGAVATRGLRHEIESIALHTEPLRGVFNFDQHDQGWTADADTQNLAWNAGGYMTCAEFQTGAYRYWVAPPTALGHHQGVYGGVLTFKMQTSHNEQDLPLPLVEIDAGTLGVLRYFTAQKPSTSQQTTFFVPLSATPLSGGEGWTLDGSTVTLSEQTMRWVMDSPRSMRIRAEFSTEDDICLLDDVVLNETFSGSACDPIDFNGDGLFPDTQDIADFLDVFGGGACPTGLCGDIDFNNDGLFPDTSDIDSLLSVFSGGACL